MYGCNVSDRRCDWVGESMSVDSMGWRPGFDLLLRKEKITFWAVD